MFPQAAACHVHHACDNAFVWPGLGVQGLCCPAVLLLDPVCWRCLPGVHSHYRVCRLATGRCPIQSASCQHGACCSGALPAALPAQACGNDRAAVWCDYETRWWLIPVQGWHGLAPSLFAWEALCMQPPAVLPQASCCSGASQVRAGPCCMRCLLPPAFAPRSAGLACLWWRLVGCAFLCWRWQACMHAYRGAPAAAAAAMHCAQSQSYSLQSGGIHTDHSKKYRPLGHLVRRQAIGSALAAETVPTWRCRHGGV